MVSHRTRSRGAPSVWIRVVTVLCFSHLVRGFARTSTLFADRSHGTPSSHEFRLQDDKAKTQSQNVGLRMKAAVVEAINDDASAQCTSLVRLGMTCSSSRYSKKCDKEAAEISRLESSAVRTRAHLSLMESTEKSSCSSCSMILLLNGDVYTPRSIGTAHVLLGGKSILAIFRDQEYDWSKLLGLPVEVIDVNGSVVVPGFIDIHVHIAGGGGEAGPASRTPEAALSELVNAGITTLVGILGTDCVSRSLEGLRAKAAALKDEGLSAHMWSGCYRVPSLTLTGSLVRDLQLIEEVVGAGEIAISDHRGSWPSTNELIKMVSDARVGGMLSGKAGVVHFHTGAAASLLDPLWEIINVSKGAIPITQMLPTHMSSRGQDLLKAAETWMHAGGRVDLTADQEGEHDTFSALKEWHKKGSVPLNQISLSSDGFGSLPSYDTDGRLLKYDIASPLAILKTIRKLVLTAGWTLEETLPLSTINPATFLSFTQKGRLEVGLDADILVLEPGKLQLEYVIAMGQVMKTPNWTKKGLFER